ncbi:60S ribosomal protein L35a-4, partial [Bienertia sinuspersici]
GVNTKEEVSWYLGNKLAYICKAGAEKIGSHYRCIGLRFVGLMVTLMLFVLSSSPTSLLSLWYKSLFFKKKLIDVLLIILIAR